jgi:predicted GNAT family acetyltransferase
MRTRRVEPDAAYFDDGLGEFLLPYRALRTADDPDTMLLAFLQSTYEAAADLAEWDRRALEASSGPGAERNGGRMPPVVDRPDESRFVVEADGETAELTYKLHDRRFTLVHTGVPDAIGGRGIAGALVRAAVARAAAEGLTIVPRCPYARRWLREHPGDAARVTVEWPQD